MPRYRLVIAASAKKDIDKLDRVVRKRLAQKLRFFMDQDDPHVHARQLVHSKLGSYRFRVGHYRIIFDVRGTEIQVLSVKHRKDVYRG